MGWQRKQEERKKLVKNTKRKDANEDRKQVKELLRRYRAAG
jgi:hypothetical protein